MNKTLINSKIRAFIIHFGISFVIFLILLYFVIFHWYPTPFFTTDGGWQGIRLIVLVDLVLGPVLTFVVFNPIKKTTRHLKMDLSIIALCQVAALIWGTWAVHNERPYLIIFSDQTFYGLPYYQIKETGLTKSDVSKFGHTAPIKVFTDMPTRPDERLAIFNRAMEKQVPPHFLSEYYRPFDKNSLEKLVSSGIKMTTFLKGKDSIANQRYEKFAQKYSSQLENLLFFPLRARYGKFIVAVNKVSLEFVDVLNIEPPVIDEWEGRENYIKKLNSKNL